MSSVDPFPELYEVFLTFVYDYLGYDSLHTNACVGDILRLLKHDISDGVVASLCDQQFDSIMNEFKYWFHKDDENTTSSKVGEILKLYDLQKTKI